MGSKKVDINGSYGDLCNQVKRFVLKKYDEKAIIYVYPIGFIRLPFEKDRYTDGLALHLWLRELPNQEKATLHTHIFDLESRILSGRVTDMQWRIEDSKEGAHMLTLATYANDEYTLQEQQDVQIVLERQQEHIAGDAYSVPKNVFHSSIADNGTLTLIQKKNIDSAIKARVGIPKGVEQETGYVANVLSLSQDEAWDMLLKAVVAL